MAPMPTLYALKPAFQSRLRPLVRQLAGRGVTANMVTVAATVLSIAAGAAIACFPESRAALVALPVVLFLRMALNAIDGMLAREHGQASKLGLYLNEVGDVISDAALILPFALVPGFQPWAVIAFAFVAVLTEFVGVLGIAAGGRRDYAGPFGKSDRALALGIVAALCAFRAWPAWLVPLAFPILLAASLLTVVNRIRAGLIGPG